LVDEKLQSGWDRLNAACVLAWTMLVVFLQSTIDVLTGREVPHPDLKQVAPSPEPSKQGRAA
jgi:hypothetical protein